MFTVLFSALPVPDEPPKIIPVKLALKVPLLMFTVLPVALPLIDEPPKIE